MINAYLQGAEEVAFEAFFGEAFFGVRFTGSSRDVEARARACVSVLQHALDGAHFFSQLAGEGILPTEGLDFASTEIGAVNAWNSVTAFRIPVLEEAQERFAALWTDLIASPLALDSSHRKAIEFIVRDPLHLWFALPVSFPEPPFGLDPQRLRAAIHHSVCLGSGLKPCSANPAPTHHI